MFRFENPQYLYLLAGIAFLALVHGYAMYAKRKDLRTYGDPELLGRLFAGLSRWRPEVKFWLCQLALASFVVALARPQFGTRMEKQERQGIEALIALDVSNSMLAEDVKPNRLEKAKMMISNMVENMKDDKVGLIVYAGQAFTQLPITSDYVSARMFLETISPAMVSVQGTDIAAAIDLATRSFTAPSSSSQTARTTREEPWRPPGMPPGRECACMCWASDRPAAPPSPSPARPAISRTRRATWSSPSSTRTCAAR